MGQGYWYGGPRPFPQEVEFRIIASNTQVFAPIVFAWDDEVLLGLDDESLVLIGEKT